MKNQTFNILIFIILVKISKTQFIDYTDQYLIKCQDINPNLDFSESMESLWKISIIHLIDRIIFLSISPIVILYSILLIAVFLKFKKSLFKNQGTIFFSIIVVQTILNCYYFIHTMIASIITYEYNLPLSFQGFCLSMGIINQIGKLALNLYLIYFVIFTLFTMKKSIRTKQVIKIKILHISVAIICIGWVLFVYFDQRMGINQFGLCGQTYLRNNYLAWFFPTFKILLNCAFLILSFYTYYYCKKHKPLVQGLVKRLYHQNQKISYFVIVQSILICLFDFSIGIVYFNCFQDNPMPQLLFFATVMNISRILQAIFLIYFVQCDPTIKKKIKKFLRSFFRKNTFSQMSFHLQRNQIDTIDFNNNQIDLTIRQRILQLKQQEHEIDLCQITQIMTIIAGIIIGHKEYFNEGTFNHVIKKLHFKQKITFNIENKSLHDYNIKVSNIPKAGILKGSITLTAPRIFNKLLNSDGLSFVQKSFDLQENYKKMYNIAEGNGGKSGQFFFFSYDYKYVLKTITKEEFNFIEQNLSEFYQYYEKNPNSLLAKIYGLYTIKTQDIEVTYDIILMKNIFGCQKNQVIRTYDLKGSRHNRQVMKQKGNVNQLQSLTLKDTDFLNLQAKLQIAPQIINEFRMIVKKDSLFLKNLNLIDYSLLLIRVKWLIEPQNKKFWNRFQRIPSAVSIGQYYHIGIIDYMQAWNMSKRSENWFKNLLGKKQISAQQPNFYQRRFMQFVDSITRTPQFQIYSLKQSSSVKSSFFDFKTQDYNPKVIMQLLAANKYPCQSLYRDNISDYSQEFNISAPQHSIRSKKQSQLHKQHKQHEKSNLVFKAQRKNTELLPMKFNEQ